MGATQDTIYALSSGHGRAGVAVIRICGPRARQTLIAMAGSLPRPRHATFTRLHNPASGTRIDEALCLWFPGPASFSGDDTAELHIHGGRAVTAAVLAALADIEGLRLAEPGEFTRRAFLNGKMDLTQAEGLADLIDAETEAQRAQALAQSTGALRHVYETWRHALIEAMALIEATLDFADERDVPDGAANAALETVRRLRDEIAGYLDDGQRGEIVRDGYQVVIAGPPNAGKSSLLNALARRDVAIVSTQAGTTRDIIEVRLDLQGHAVIVSDTAGVRASHDPIEQEGIRRALAKARQADLILWLIDGTGPYHEPPVDLNLPKDQQSNIRTVITKRDLAPASLRKSGVNPVHVSATTGAGLSDLSQLIVDHLQARIGSGEAPAITRARHREALIDCLRALDVVVKATSLDFELIAEELRSAAAALGRLTGCVGVEDLLDQVFSSFCIGK